MLYLFTRNEKGILIKYEKSTPLIGKRDTFLPYSGSRHEAAKAYP